MCAGTSDSMQMASMTAPAMMIVRRRPPARRVASENAPPMGCTSIDTAAVMLTSVARTNV